MSEQQEQQTPEFEVWGILEIMGHRKFGGRLTEACIAGAKFIQINFYGVNGEVGYQDEEIYDSNQ